MVTTSPSSEKRKKVSNFGVSKEVVADEESYREQKFGQK